MPLLLVCVVLFFGVAQLYQWSSGLTLPFPVLLLAGAGLAVVSNLRDQRGSSEDPVPQSVSLPKPEAAAPALPLDIRPAADPRPAAVPQLPMVAPPAPPAESISFDLSAKARSTASPNSQGTIVDSDRLSDAG